MKKIAIVIPCWKRNEVLKLTIDQLNLVCKSASGKVEIMVVYALSTDDPELNMIMQHIALCEYKAMVVFSDNNFLGQKINDAITVAMALECDYIMNMGSDDIVHPDMIDLYLPYIEMEVPVFGLASVWFYQKGEKPFLFNNYNSNYIVGAGRMIHKNVITKVNSKFGVLYNPEIKKAMDGHSAGKIMDCGFEQIIVYSKEDPLIVDLKSDVNITSFENLKINGLSKLAIKEFDVKISEFFPIMEQYEQN